MLEDKYSMSTNLLIKLHNTVTGQTLKNQDLTGTLLNTSKLHRKLAEDLAQQYAHKHTIKTQQLWTGTVEEYTPGKNKL